MRFKPSLHIVLVQIIVTAMVFGPPMSVVMADAPIVADGRTQTSIHVNGNITDVRTETIRGNTGFNSFERFNVPAETTTNLHLPDATRNLVNLVHNERSFIDGTLNSLLSNGQIGGNTYFLNPHGILVGQSGTVNVGSLHLITPTTQFMDELISSGGVISDVHTQRLFEGNVPLSESGLISVRGRVNAVDTITIAANDASVDAGASVRAGRQVQVEFGSIVNTEGLQTGNELVMGPDGRISIVAANDVSVAGRIAVDGIQGEDAGSIEIRSGNDIHINAGAEISARGVGQGSNGATIKLEATNSILLDNVFLSSRQVNDTGLTEEARRNAHLTGNSTGNSGNITLQAPTIELTNSRLLSFATGIHNAGNILLDATNSITLTGSHLDAGARGTGDAGDVVVNVKDIDNFNIIPIYVGQALAQFSMTDNSEIVGGNITIDVKAFATPESRW